MRKSRLNIAAVLVTVCAFGETTAQYMPGPPEPDVTEVGPPIAPSLPYPPDGTRDSVHLSPALALRSYVLGGTLPTKTGNPFASPPPVHRAFFCRFDDDLDAKRIPLRMRLGDLETVNKKEGKPGW